MRTAGRAIALAVGLAFALAACGGDDDDGDTADAKLRVANASCEGALADVAPTGTLASYTFTAWGTIRDDVEGAAEGLLPQQWSVKPANETVTECSYLVIDNTANADCSVVTVAIVIDATGVVLPDARIAADDSCSANED